MTPGVRLLALLACAALVLAALIAVGRRADGGGRDVWSFGDNPAAADEHRAVVAPPGKDDWPLSRGNALQTGVAPAALPDKLAELWKFSAQDSIEAAVAVAEGVVYVGAMDKHLYA